ncbi:MAG: CYTH domain-containing protein [Coriobacteriia bacterium]|nr:CYTH domain-containing protein [Coriobacteriia bacterium]
MMNSHDAASPPTGVEIERKFLLLNVPEEVLAAPGVSVRQGYLVVGTQEEARIRQADDAYTLTVKSGAGIRRGEYEIALSREQFASLWPATEGRRIEKRRHAVPLPGDLVAEVDLYDGPLAGLAVAEVEFVSLDRARAFEPPGWFDADVTDDGRYKNAALARDGRPS